MKTTEPTIVSTSTQTADLIPLVEIRIDERFQLRHKNGSLKRVDSTAGDYAEIKAEHFPPVVVARSEDRDLNGCLLSGFTRVKAAQIRNDTQIPGIRAEVATIADAFTIAAKENAKHGLRLTKEDRLNQARMLDGLIPREEIANVVQVAPSTITNWLGAFPKMEDAELNAILDDELLTRKEKAEKARLTPRRISQLMKERREGVSSEHSDTDGDPGEVDNAPTGEDLPSPDPGVATAPSPVPETELGEGQEEATQEGETIQNRNHFPPSTDAVPAAETPAQEFPEPVYDSLTVEVVARKTSEFKAFLLAAKEAEGLEILIGPIMDGLKVIDRMEFTFRKITTNIPAQE